MYMFMLCELKMTLYSENNSIRQLNLNCLEWVYFPLLQEYRTRAEIGVSSLPAGLEYYRAALRLYLGEDWSPADIHQLGLREVERIKARMEEVRISLGCTLVKTGAQQTSTS